MPFCYFGIYRLNSINQELIYVICHFLGSGPVGDYSMLSFKKIILRNMKIEKVAKEHIVDQSALSIPLLFASATEYARRGL